MFVDSRAKPLFEVKQMIDVFHMRLLAPVACHAWQVTQEIARCEKEHISDQIGQELEILINIFVCVPHDQKANLNHKPNSPFLFREVHPKDQHPKHDDILVFATVAELQG